MGKSPGLIPIKDLSHSIHSRSSKFKNGAFIEIPLTRHQIFAYAHGMNLVPFNENSDKATSNSEDARCHHCRRRIGTAALACPHCLDHVCSESCLLEHRFKVHIVNRAMTEILLYLGVASLLTILGGIAYVLHGG